MIAQVDSGVVGIVFFLILVSVSVYVHAQFIRAAIVLLNRFSARTSPIPELSASNAVAVAVGALVLRVFLLAFAWAFIKGSSEVSRTISGAMGSEPILQAAYLLSIFTDMFAIRVGWVDSLGKSLLISFSAFVSTALITIGCVVAVVTLFPDVLR